MRKILAVIFLILFFATPAWATTTNYYFALDGDDTKDCDSWANRCKTIERMNDLMIGLSDVGAGDTVRLLAKEGDNWDYATAANFENGSLSREDDQIKIVVSGANSTSHFVLGACDSSGNYISGESSNKPIIDGDTTQPGYQYDGLIEVENENYVTIENWIVRDNYGTATLPASLIRTKDVVGVKLQYLDLEDSWGNCITGQNFDSGYILDNTLTDCVLRASGQCTLGPGSGMSIQYASTNEIKRNSVTYVYGEGINILHSSNNNTVSENFVCTVRSALIYIDRNGDNNTVQHNFGCQTNEAAYMRNGTSPNCTDRSNGFRISNEVLGYGDDTSEYNIIHGNIAIAMRYGFSIASGPGTTQNNTISSNTAIDCDDNYEIGLGSGTTQNNTYINNASVVYDDANSDHVADALTGHGTSTYFAWHDEAPDDASWQDAGTDQIGDIKLTKTSGWRSVATCATFEAVWATLTAGSSAIDSGSGAVTLLDPDSTWPSAVTTMSANEMGAYGFEQPDPDSDTGLYLVIGGDKYLTHKGTKKLILSGE